MERRIPPIIRRPEPPDPPPKRQPKPRGRWHWAFGVLLALLAWVVHDVSAGGAICP